jgi:LEA14-like dessication related protein
VAEASALPFRVAHSGQGALSGQRDEEKGESMKKALKVLGAVMGLILLLGLLTVILVPREKLLSYLAPDIGNITVTDATITETTAEMKAQLEVSSKLIPVFVDSLEYDFQLYNQSVAQGRQKFTPDSKSRQVQQLIIPVRVKHNQARELVRRQIAEGEKMRAQVTAWCRFPLIGVRQIDIDQQVAVALPVLPGAEITGLKVNDLGLDNMAMTMTMAIDNPNNFDFYLRQMTYTIQLKDYMTSAGKINKPYLIKARQVTNIELPATADVKRPLKAGFKALTGDRDWPYHMKSKMVLKPRSRVVGKVYMNADKYGVIDVVHKLKELKEIKKQKKQQEKSRKKA